MLQPVVEEHRDSVFGAAGGILLMLMLATKVRPVCVLGDFGNISALHATHYLGASCCMHPCKTRKPSVLVPLSLQYIWRTEKVLTKADIKKLGDYRQYVQKIAEQEEGECCYNRCYWLWLKSQDTKEFTCTRPAYELCFVLNLGRLFHASSQGLYKEYFKTLSSMEH